MAAVILLPILFGALIPLLPFKNRTQMMIYIETVVLAAFPARAHPAFEPAGGCICIVPLKRKPEHQASSWMALVQCLRELYRHCGRLRRYMHLSI